MMWSEYGIKLWHQTMASNYGIKLWHQTMASNYGIRICCNAFSPRKTCVPKTDTDLRQWSQTENSRRNSFCNTTIMRSKIAAENGTCIWCHIQWPSSLIIFTAQFYVRNSYASLITMLLIRSWRDICLHDLLLAYFEFIFLHKSWILHYGMRQWREYGSAL